MEARGTSSAIAREAATRLNERGYAILPRLAEPAVMDQLLAEVKPWADRAERLQLKFFGGGLRKVESVLTKSRAFVTLLANPVLHELNELILGPESLLNGSAVFILESGGRDQTLHNDGTIYEPMLPRAPGGPHYLLIYMWAVTDFTKENGATRAIPGSHLWPAGRTPSDADPVDYLEMPRGSVAVWLGSTFHAASANHTGTARVGTQMGFNCGWLRPHEANLLLVPPLVVRDMPLNVQEVLGYRAYRGMLGCIEQQSPGEWLGINASLGSTSNRVVDAPDPFDIEACTRDYFSTRTLTIPVDLLSELNQLAQTNAARAAAASEDDREVLEVVARSQSRHLMSHVLEGNHAELAMRLRQLGTARGTAIGEAIPSAQETP